MIQIMYRLGQAIVYSGLKKDIKELKEKYTGTKVNGSKFVCIDDPSIVYVWDQENKTWVENQINVTPGGNAGLEYMTDNEVSVVMDEVING